MWLLLAAFAYSRLSDVPHLKERFEQVGVQYLLSVGFVKVFVDFHSFAGRKLALT